MQTSDVDQEQDRRFALNSDPIVSPETQLFVAIRFLLFVLASLRTTSILLKYNTFFVARTLNRGEYKFKYEALLGRLQDPSAKRMEGRHKIYG